MYSLRLASGSTGLGYTLVRFGGKRSSTPAVSLLAPNAAGTSRRSVYATPNAAAPVPGDQDVGMEPGKQKQQPPPPPHRDAGEQQQQHGDDTHKQTTAKGDVMTHSFGEGYSTRSDEEGFGGTYGGNDTEFNPSGGDVHPNHPSTTGRRDRR